MKKMFFVLCSIAIGFTSCDSKAKDESTATVSSTESKINLPYKRSYDTEFTQNVSDSDLLLVLNSYKYWENGDLAALRATMGDSMTVNGSDGFSFTGKTDSLMPIWKAHRDSMSSVVITMDAWLRNHAVLDSANYVNVYYKEVDTYKSGRVDSSYYADVNAVKNGKVTWFSSYRQTLKK